MGQQQAEGQQQDGGELTRALVRRALRVRRVLFGTCGRCIGSCRSRADSRRVAAGQLRCRVAHRTGRLGQMATKGCSVIAAGSRRASLHCVVYRRHATPTVGGGLRQRTHAHAAQVGAGQRGWARWRVGLQVRRGVSAVVYVSLVCSARCGHSPDDVWGPHPSARQTSF